MDSLVTATNRTPESESKKTPGSSKKSAGLSASMTYVQLVHDAIVAMKDRTGSSQIAIQKYILGKHPELECPHFKSRVNQAVKTGVKNERFQKIKASYKISADYKAKERAKKKKKAASLHKTRTVAETKENNAKRLKQLETTLSPEELAKAKEEMRKKEEAARRRAEAERKAKERADRIRRRRFPMEDTKLHAEDKELSVKPPPDVANRPYLPYFWNLTLPLNDPTRHGKTTSGILQASKVDGLDYGNRGLVPDLLQVYHFFRGDVHFVGDDDENPIVPAFTLSNLVFAVEQVLNGNARRSRMVPPLLSHLFCTCLQILCQPPDDTLTGAERQLRKDFSTYLRPALTPASWADVCYLYMDAMERYFCSDASRNPNVLQPLSIDIEYLLGVRDEAVIPMTPFLPKGKKSENLPLPDGFQGYLGDQYTHTVS